MLTTVCLQYRLEIVTSYPRILIIIDDAASVRKAEHNPCLLALQNLFFSLVLGCFS